MVMRKNKDLGQVFLKDQKYVRRIISAMDIKSADVLEIGPGAGVMTSHLLRRSSRLWCVEFDARFAERLKKNFASSSNLWVLNKDILTVDLAEISRDLIVFGNVPYNISYQLITYIIEQRKNIRQVFMTFQKEFAYKLAAVPGEKAYSFLTCYFRCFCEGEVLFDIPKQAFSPRPKVDSAFIKIDFLDQPLCPEEKQDALFKLIKKAFSQRRKKILNSLSGRYDKKTVHAMCAYAQVSSDARPEQISPEQYLSMLEFLDKNTAA